MATEEKDVVDPTIYSQTHDNMKPLSSKPVDITTMPTPDGITTTQPTVPTWSDSFSASESITTYPSLRHYKIASNNLQGVPMAPTGHINTFHIMQLQSDNT